MKETLEIRVYGIDGSIDTFFHEDPDLIHQTLSELHPATLYTQDRITLADDCLQKSFLPPLLTRIDLVTNRLSVWDFPFALGAMDELLESEFEEKLRLMREENPGDSLADRPVFLDLEMLNGRHIFLGMEIVAGLPQARLNKIYSLLKRRKLIFGLQNAGVGIVNLANLLRLSVHPDIPPHQKCFHLIESDDCESSAEINQL